MADDIARLRAQAAKYRRMTALVDDPKTVESLKRMAKASDDQADRLESRNRPRPEPPRLE